jgi:hypothetical protein
MTRLQYSITLTPKVAKKLEGLVYARRLERMDQGQEFRGLSAADLVREALGEYLELHSNTATASQEGKCTTTIQ